MLNCKVYFANFITFAPKSEEYYFLILLILINGLD